MIGFNVIGESGCGKTSALKIALSYYPKVIRHTLPDGRKVIQIPYLLVQCPPHSNFKSLYERIGEQIDRVLGNTNKYYQNYIMGRSRSSLGEMLNRVQQLIDELAIGLIVFDEVQQINFSTQTENSFNALMSMANSTMVGLVIVGTSEAIEMITQVEQIGRRVGPKVPCDEYKFDESFFNSMMIMLLKYSWFQNGETITKEMQHEMYLETHGVVAYLVLLYMLLQTDYVIQAEKPTVDLNYLKAVEKKYFSIIKRTLDRKYKDGSTRDTKIRQATKDVKQQLDDIVALEREKQSKKFITENAAGMMQEEVTRQYVVSTIQNLSDDYTEEFITDIFKEVYDRNSELSNKQYASLVLKKLSTKKRKSRKPIKDDSGKNISLSSMSKYIDDITGNPNDPFAK